MPALIVPSTELHSAFLRCREDWGPGVHEDGFGLTVDDEVRTSAGFATWVDRLLHDEHPPHSQCPDHQHATHRWITQNDEIVGAIALRHHADEQLGQLGYGVRPSARRQGLATWAVGQMLEVAREIGMADITVVCEFGNVASAQTIERQGGVLVSTRDTDNGRFRLYSIAIS